MLSLFLLTIATLYIFAGYYFMKSLLVFKQTVLGVGVVGTTSDQSVLKPTPAQLVLDAIGDPSVLEP